MAGVQSVRVEGSDVSSATLKIQIYSTGTDENEARALGKRTQLTTSTAGDILSLDVDYPPEERQRTMLTLTLPRTLRVRVARASSIEIIGVAGVEFDETRGEATLTRIGGVIRGTHTGGELTFDTVKDVDMTARRSDLTIKNASGSVRLDLTGGQLVAREVAGGVTLDGNRVSAELDGVRGPLTADLTQGSLEVTRLSAQARIDARGTELRLTLHTPAAVTAITTDENISVRLPETGGVSLDATVEDGEIRVPDGVPAPSATDRSAHARAAIRGGGPTIVLRTTHGDIVVR
jgi:DUF4097 and DUF4098 domain-containing protein YvlB